MTCVWRQRLKWYIYKPKKIKQLLASHMLESTTRNPNFSLAKKIETWGALSPYPSPKKKKKRLIMAESSQLISDLPKAIIFTIYKTFFCFTNLGDI